MTRRRKLQILYDATPLMTMDEFIEYYKVMGDKVRHLVCKEIFSHPGISGKEILVKFKVSQPTISFHIAQLVKLGIIVDRKDGQRHLYYPNFHKVLSFYKTSGEHHYELKNIIGDMFSDMQNTIKRKK